MTEEQIAKLWSDSTQSTWPKNGKFTAGSTSQNLLDFTLAVVEYKRQELRERIAISQLAALTSVYWEEETAKSYATAGVLIKCHCETAVEYADALIKELNKEKND